MAEKEVVSHDFLENTTVQENDLRKSSKNENESDEIGISKRIPLNKIMNIRKLN